MASKPSFMKRINMRLFKASAIFVVLTALAAVMFWRAGETAAQKRAEGVKNTFAEKPSAGERAFSEFDEWVKRYLSGDFSDESAFISKGENLALRRRELFKDLIRTNPRTAIEKAVFGRTAKASSGFHYSIFREKKKRKRRFQCLCR